jgi:hypothetical protein
LEIRASGFGEEPVVPYVTVLPAESEKAISANLTGFLQIGSSAQIDATITGYNGASDYVVNVGGVAIDNDILQWERNPTNAKISIKLSTNPIQGSYDLIIRHDESEQTPITVIVQPAIAPPPTPTPTGGAYAT